MASKKRRFGWHDKWKAIGLEEDVVLLSYLVVGCSRTLEAGPNYRLNMSQTCSTWSRLGSHDAETLVCVEFFFQATLQLHINLDTSSEQVTVRC